MQDAQVFGLGNPLLDIAAHVDDDFLKKFDLPKNSAILAEAKHEKLYEDLIAKYDIEYSAGGATQNTMRFCEWVVGKNNSVTTFLGCVGDDYFGKIMEKKAKQDGVGVKYQVDDTGTSTGTCAVLITDGGKSRSLVAYLGASNNLKAEHFTRNKLLLEKAQVCYTSGHMLAVSPDSVLSMAKHSHEWGKDFMLNIGAPYVSQKYSKQLLELLPYVDFIFGNSEEFAAFATMKGYATKDPKEIAKLVSKEPKIKYNNPKIPRSYKMKRTVVLTQEANPVLVASSDSEKVQEFPVIKVPQEKIADTNGAGDAFTGGFLAMYIQGKPFELCIKCAIYCATECIQQTGCIFPKVMNFKP